MVETVSEGEESVDLVELQLGSRANGGDPWCGFCHCHHAGDCM
jgi:hypothetical protein